MPGAPPARTNDPAPPGAKAAVGRVWRQTAVIALGFSLAVCGVMVWQQVQHRSHDPLKAQQIAALKEKLAGTPNDDRIKQEIRQVDLNVRHRFFRELSLTHTGAWLLLGGAIVFLAAIRQRAALRRKLPLPAPRPNATEEAARTATFSRWAFGASGVVIAMVLFSLAFGVRTSLPTSESGLAKITGAGSTEGAPIAELPSPAEMQANWPRFRGFDGGGVSAQTNAPLTWDVKSGAGVAWKTAVPTPGFNSPVVWGERVFLSGGDATHREVFCFSANSGELLWRREVQTVADRPGPAVEIPEQTGYAASTVATDGRRVYVMFGNGDLAAFGFDGNPAWAKHLDTRKNPYGHATSLATWREKLLVQVDQGGGDSATSRLLAIDGATGRIVWERPRPVSAAWATPIVIQAAGRPQIITPGNPWVIAYAPGDGSELWRVECLGGEVTPSPIFAAGAVIVVSPNERLLALRPDGQGDVTKTHVLWTAQDNPPDITSPVSNGEFIFTVTTPGVLTCVEATTGKKVWEHELGLDFHASPGISGERLYLISTQGVVVVAAVGKEFKELARSELGEPVSASPAFVRNRIFIRGQRHLYCIGSVAPPEELAKQR